MTAPTDPSKINWKKLQAKYAEFAMDSATDLNSSGIIPYDITPDIRVALEPMLVAQQFLEENTQLVGTSGHTLSIRLEAAMSDAADFNPGADVTQASTGQVFSTVDISPTKFGHSEVIYEEAIDDADFNTIMQTQNALARGLARRSDARVWNSILNLTTATETATGDSAAKLYSVTNDAVVEFTLVSVNAVTVTLGTDYWVDMFRGRLQFLAAPGVVTVSATYIYTDRTNLLEAETIGVLSRNDLVNSANQIKSVYGQADLCAMNESQQYDLVKDPLFTSAADYGTNVPQLNGEVGRTAGINILVSQKMYDGVTVVAQSGYHLGALVWKKKPVVVVEDMEFKSGDVRAKIWTRHAVGIRDETLMSVIFNTHQYALSLSVGTPKAMS